MDLSFLFPCRYVIRARAGKKQSSKDASGKIAHSAGASIRRYNELALKKVFMVNFSTREKICSTQYCTKSYCAIP